ncbi:MAG: hypothetical protein WBG24_16270 [Syntrophobacteria bacterium]
MIIPVNKRWRIVSTPTCYQVEKGKIARVRGKPQQELFPEEK